MVCFAAIPLVIVLTWFPGRQCHVIKRQRHVITRVIKADSRYTSREFRGIGRDSSDCYEISTEFHEVG